MKKILKFSMLIALMASGSAYGQNMTIKNTTSCSYHVTVYSHNVPSGSCLDLISNVFTVGAGVTSVGQPTYLNSGSCLSPGMGTYTWSTASSVSCADASANWDYIEVTDGTSTVDVGNCGYSGSGSGTDCTGTGTFNVSWTYGNINTVLIY